MMCIIHKHGLDHKLVRHLNVTRLDYDEKENVVKMTMNMVQPKSILEN